MENAIGVSLPWLIMVLSRCADEAEGMKGKAGKDRRERMSGRVE